MNLNFNQADVQENTTNANRTPVIKTGIHDVVTSELKGGITPTEKQSPYIDWTVVDAKEAICTHRFYTSEAAWKISASAFLQLLMAITKQDKETCRASLNTIASSAKDMPDFATKLSALVVGKPFQIKINGEEVISKVGTKFVKSKFGNWTFALPVGEDPKGLGKVYIKPLPTMESAEVSTDTTNDLPF